jgi:hypothetical protein
MARGEEGLDTMLASLGSLYAAGLAVDWRARHAAGRTISLPEYPWQRGRYWVSAAAVGPAARDEPPREGHRALGGHAYEVSWPRAPLAGRPAQPADRWIVLGDDGFTDLLAERLGAGRMQAAGLPEALSGQRPGVVYVSGPGYTAEPDAQRIGHVLEVIQRLAGAGRNAPARLWIVTRHAQAVLAGDPAPDLTGAALWGLGRTLALEHPGLWGGLADADGTAAAAGALAASLLRHDGEDQVAFREAHRFAARLVPFRAADPGRPAVPVRPDGCYLITGGLGGIGLHLARWLAARGARHITLMGRGAPSEAAGAVLAGLSAGGAEVTVIQGDVSRAEDVATAMRRIDAGLPPLRGVLHAAGVLDDGILLNQSTDRIARVLAPKAAGAAHLDALTRTRPLDFFVLFSSVSALLGTAGQAGYAAANAALDALALRRRAEGLPALSVGWGPWDRVGMASGISVSRQRRDDRGLRAFDPETALGLLERALPATSGHVGIFDIDWTRCRDHPGSAGRPPLLSALGGGPDRNGAREHGHHAAGRGTTLAQRTSAVSPADRPELVTAHVSRRVAEVIGLPQDRSVARDAGLFEMGVDSLMAVRLASLLAADVADVPGAAELPPVVAFTHPTVNALAGYLLGLLGEAGADGSRDSAEAAGEGGAAGLDALVTQIENLPEDEVARLLAELPDVAGDGRGKRE